MRVSSKARYGLFLMAELARQYGKELVQIKPFAVKQGLSPKYLEQVVISLKKHKLIESSRGPKGGYSLEKPADEINLYEILVAVQGDLTPARCGSADHSLCRSTSKCLTVSLWALLDSSLRTTLTQTKLSDFIQHVPEFWKSQCMVAL